MPTELTEQVRRESSERLHNLLKQNELKEGEVNNVPPDPPANYGRLPEIGRGGAISQGQREVGVDVTKPPVKAHLPPDHHPLGTDVVRRRGEEKEPTPPPIREDLAPIPTQPPEDGGTVLNLPDWETVPLEDSEAWLQILRTEEERGASIINRRRGDPESGLVYHCANTACNRVVEDGKWAFAKNIRDPKTNVFHRIVVCSARCWQIWAKGPGAPKPNAPGQNLSHP